MHAHWNSPSPGLNYPFSAVPLSSLLISTSHPKHQKEGRSELDPVVFYFYWRDFQWKLRWGKCEESTIALLFLFLRRIRPVYSYNLDYRSTESKEWLSGLEQISSVRITKNRNWRAGALPWLLPSQPQRKSPDHLKKKDASITHPNWWAYARPSSFPALSLLYWNYFREEKEGFNESEEKKHIMAMTS